MSGKCKEKVLLLTGALGEGHNQAAKAILEASRILRPEMEIVTVDFLEWTHPLLHNVGKFCYLHWVKTMPSMYGYLYRKTRDENTLSKMFKKIKAFSVSRMLKLLREVQPTAVVSTFPSAAAAMSLLKSHRLTNVPTVTVITDYTNHSYWVHPHTDRYLVGSKQVRDALLRYRIPEDRIAVTGIPIRLSFSRSLDRDRLKARYGIHDDVPTVLVMGGGYGFIGRELVGMLKYCASRLPARFIIVCGRNERLREQLDRELGCYHSRIIITGYVDHVHELMALSDFMVTKPGGLTVSEALAMELPMLLYKPIPGQEQDNASYLVREGAALEARNPEELMRQLFHLIYHKPSLQKLKKKSKICTMKEGAVHALHSIVEIQGHPAPVWQEVGRPFMIPHRNV